MKSWMERLGLMLAMLAMLLMAAVPAMASHDDECEDGFEWDDDEEECVWAGGDFDELDFGTFEVELECSIDADADGWHDEDWEDGEDNDWDGWIDEDDIDCVVEEVEFD